VPRSLSPLSPSLSPYLSLSLAPSLPFVPSSVPPVLPHHPSIPLSLAIDETTYNISISMKLSAPPSHSCLLPHFLTNCPSPPSLPSTLLSSVDSIKMFCVHAAGFAAARRCLPFLVCLLVYLRISQATCPYFTKFSVHVTCRLRGLDSVLF